MTVRRFFDTVYGAAGALACLFLISIVALTLATICARSLGVTFYSTDEFSGWSMAASTFLGLAATMRRNEHIRVTVFIERLVPTARKRMELVCLIVASTFMGLFAWHAVHMVVQSYQFGELTQGIVPVPLWIPQSGMAVGCVLMFIALADDLLRSLCGKQTSYQAAPATSITEAI